MTRQEAASKGGGCRGMRSGFTRLRCRSAMAAALWLMLVPTTALRTAPPPSFVGDCQEAIVLSDVNHDHLMNRYPEYVTYLDRLFSPDDDARYLYTTARGGGGFQSLPQPLQDNYLNFAAAASAAATTNKNGHEIMSSQTINITNAFGDGSLLLAAAASGEHGGVALLDFCRQTRQSMIDFAGSRSQQQQQGRYLRSSLTEKERATSPPSVLLVGPYSRKQSSNNNYQDQEPRAVPGTLLLRGSPRAREPAIGSDNGFVANHNKGDTTYYTSYDGGGVVNYVGDTVGSLGSSSSSEGKAGVADGNILLSSGVESLPDSKIDARRRLPGGDEKGCSVFIQFSDLNEDGKLAMNEFVVLVNLLTDDKILANSFATLPPALQQTFDRLASGGQQILLEEEQAKDNTAISNPHLNLFQHGGQENLAISFGRLCRDTSTSIAEALSMNNNNNNNNNDTTTIDHAQTATMTGNTNECTKKNKALFDSDGDGLLMTSDFARFASAVSDRANQVSFQDLPEEVQTVFLQLAMEEAGPVGGGLSGFFSEPVGADDELVVSFENICKKSQQIIVVMRANPPGLPLDQKGGPPRLNIPSPLASLFQDETSSSNSDASNIEDSDSRQVAIPGLPGQGEETPIPNTTAPTVLPGPNTTAPTALPDPNTTAPTALPDPNTAAPTALPGTPSPTAANTTPQETPQPNITAPTLVPTAPPGTENPTSAANTSQPTTTPTSIPTPPGTLQPVLTRQSTLSPQTTPPSPAPVGTLVPQPTLQPTNTTAPQSTLQPANTTAPQPTVAPNSTRDTVTAHNSWIMSNSLGLTSDDLIAGPGFSEIQRAYDAFAAEIVAEMVASRPSRSMLRRRRLEVSLQSGSSNVYRFVNSVCPVIAAAADNCLTAFGQVNLIVVDEDADKVYNEYVDISQIAIDGGVLQEKLNEVAPGSLWFIEGASTPVEPPPGLTEPPVEEEDARGGADLTLGLITSGAVATVLVIIICLFVILPQMRKNRELKLIKKDALEALRGAEARDRAAAEKMAQKVEIPKESPKTGKPPKTAHDEEDNPYREDVERLINQNCPDMIDELDSLLHQYQGREEDLIAILEDFKTTESILDVDSEVDIEWDSDSLASSVSESFANVGAAKEVPVAEVEVDNEESEKLEPPDSREVEPLDPPGKDLSESPPEPEPAPTLAPYPQKEPGPPKRVVEDDITDEQQTMEDDWLSTSSDEGYQVHWFQKNGCWIQHKVWPDDEWSDDSESYSSDDDESADQHEFKWARGDGTWVKEHINEDTGLLDDESYTSSDSEEGEGPKWVQKNGQWAQERVYGDDNLSLGYSVDSH